MLLAPLKYRFVVRSEFFELDSFMHATFVYMRVYKYVCSIVWKKCISRLPNFFPLPLVAKSTCLVIYMDLCVLVSFVHRIYVLFELSFLVAGNLNVRI